MAETKDVAALLRELDAKATKRVEFATVRPAVSDGGCDISHVEIRFKSGEKYAPIEVDDGNDDLADWVVVSFALRNALPALADVLDAAEQNVGALKTVLLLTGSEDLSCIESYDAARAALVAALEAKS